MCIFAIFLTCHILILHTNIITYHKQVGVKMINYIWGAIVIISVVCGIVTGNIEQVSKAVLSGAEEAMELLISMCGMMCLWTGLMQIADSSGLTNKLANFLKPIMKFLFPDYEENSTATKAICMNITANFLGLGNAATPMGIAAMKEMNKLNSTPTIANNSMVMFVVINTASIQLIPTMMSILRQKHGAASPFDVMPAIWVSSLCSLLIGIISAKLLQNRGDKIAKL